MRKLKNRIKKKLNPCFWGVITYGITTATYAKDWFPESLVNKNTANKDTWSVIAENFVKAFELLFFAVCAFTFFRCVMTISQGIEEAKKNEGGLMAVFGSYAVMAFVYLSISITCGYLGYVMTTNFTL